jgi:(p)ppGpp synthase/HD superfamily hydrolase
MDVITDVLCEKAIKFLGEHVPFAGHNSRKPRLMHAMRVGMYLYGRKYASNIIIAGFLHDMIEWEEVKTSMIQDHFGEEILELILANTKNREIQDVDERNSDMIKRCVHSGQSALIIKTADIIDSFVWYQSQNNENELQNHCIKTAEMIFRYKPHEWEDDIYDELAKWQKSVG